MIEKAWLGLAILAAGSGTAVSQDRQGEEGKDYVELRVSRLSCVIGNNRALGVHRTRYNGVFRMASPDQKETPYVPFYAGINLENFFDARPRHPDSTIFFEPRCHPMTLTRVDETTVELHQKATPHFGIESHLRFRLKSPYYIDYKYTCIPRKSGLAGGFFGVFWASYINAPHDKSVYFLGKGASLEQPFWTQFLTQQHDRDSTLRCQSDDIHLDFEEGPPTLWQNLSPLRYSVPFYYGRFRNMVLIYIFKPGDTVRFAHSPSGGGRSESGKHRQSNPAWDFELIVPDYEVNRQYGLEMRAVYKPWAGRQDVLDEVNRYLAGRD